jgi:HK97 family phage prohead protease
MNKNEIRSFSTELRAADAMKIGGIAVPWNSLSQDLGGFREQFSRGAFSETLASTDDVLLLWSHNRSMPIASRASGNLQLRDDPGGLQFDATLNGTSWARDAHQAIASGTVRTASFMFSVPHGGDSWVKAGGELVRTVHRAKLHEISPTVMAAYQATQVGVRSIAEVLAGAETQGVIMRDLLAESIALEIERSR